MARRCVVLIIAALAPALLVGAATPTAYAAGSVSVGLTTTAQVATAAGFSAAPPAAEPRGVFGWPLAGWPRVSRPFQPPASRYGAGHRGVDLLAEIDAPVLAAGDGIVVFAAELAGRGVVSVDHPDGLRTTYEPVTPVVTPGTTVRRGQVLGLLQSGHEGCPGPACLHWGVRRGADYLDPLRLIGRWQVRLKPWAD